MNYFRCTVGGSGKGNTVTVTCAEEFAGLTITLAKTGKTYTKTCPSTAPYVVTYYGVENGTYTVSCTVDGQTYSETVIVQDISCVLNYGFTWRTWVDTASQLDSSDYDTLDEVLADEKALRELFLEHACVDYMASVGASNEDLETVINNDLCAKWINLSDYALDYLYANEVIADLMDEADKYGYGEWALMPQVPTMTSNTAPFGTVLYSSAVNNAWNAFNGDDTSTPGASNIWGATTFVNAYIGYQFTNSIKANKVKLVNALNNSSQGRTKTFKIQASNDNSTWVDLTESLILSNDGDIHYFEFNNDSYYLYYRAYILDNYTNNASYIGLTSLQFYAWAPKGNVPVMTSATAPYGEASASSAYSGRDPWRAFTNTINISSGWGAGASTGTLTYNFVNPVCVKRLKLFAKQDTSLFNFALSSFAIKASNDGTNFVELVPTTPYSNGTLLTLDLDNDNYYRYYRITANASGVYAGIQFLQYFGRELKVSVPTMTSNTAPYGTVIYGDQADSGWAAYYAFDDNTSNSWASSSSFKQNNYLGYIFTKATKVCMVTTVINTDSGASTGVKYSLQGSNDGSTWSDIETNASVGTPLFTNNGSDYKYWRLLFTSATAWNTYLKIKMVQFYGLDYSEKEFEVGTTKKWLYDHGVELETVTQYRGAMEKESDRVKVGSNTTVSYASSAGCQVNLAPYSLARMKAEDWYKDGNSNVSLIIINNSTSLTTLGFAVLSTPYNNAVDISNMNDTSLVCGQSDGSASRLYFTELWLE